MSEIPKEIRPTWANKDGYLRRLPRPDEPTPDGYRIVHNFYPGPFDNPGEDRNLGLRGFRAFLSDEHGQRCYCGWLEGREHYGTVSYINRKGQRFSHGIEELEA